MTLLATKKRLQQRSRASWGRGSRSSGSASTTTTSRNLWKPWKERLYQQQQRSSTTQHLFAATNTSTSTDHHHRPPQPPRQEVTTGVQKIALDVVTTAVLRHAVEEFLLLEQTITTAMTTTTTITIATSTPSSASRTTTVQRLAQALGGDVNLLDIYAEQQQEQLQIGSPEPPSVEERYYSLLHHCYRTRRRSTFVGKWFPRRRNNTTQFDPAVQRKYEFLRQLQLLQTGSEQKTILSSWKDARNALETIFEFTDESDAVNENVPTTTTTTPSRTNKSKSNQKDADKNQDDEILQNFQKRLQDIHLEETLRANGIRSKSGVLPMIGLRRPSQHAWQEIVAESSMFQQAQRDQLEQLRLKEQEAEQQKLLEQEAAAQRERQAHAQALAARYLRPLSPEQRQRLDAELRQNHRNRDPNEIIAQYEQDTCSRRSLQTLQPGTWLNDEVIHYYLILLSLRDQVWCAAPSGTHERRRRRSHFFKSFFMTKLCNDYDVNNPGVYSYANVKRWSKKVPGKDIFQLDKIFFPINQNNMHWVCAVAFMQEKRIQFYDSMGGRGQSYLDNIFRYLQDEHMDKNKCPLPDADQWQLVPCTADTPRQRNGYDCGVFTCMFCDFLAQDCLLVFGQDHVTQCRQRMALSILDGEASLMTSETTEQG